MTRAVRVYLDRRDWWIGYYRGDLRHYACPLPTLVVSWPRAVTKGPAPNVTRRDQSRSPVMRMITHTRRMNA